MRVLLAAAALAAADPLSAATIGGRLSYPSEELPGMIVVARNSSGATLSVETRPGQARYRIEVPEGRYVVFAIAVGTGVTPAPRGAHTSYSVCSRDKAAAQAGRCQSGPLEEIVVGAADKRENVDVDDWYIPDALAATLNLADLFSKYPADMAPPASTRPPDFEAAPAALKARRTVIQRAAGRGPFLAGRVAVARWGCGARCENWALVDIASGRITWMEDAQPLRADFPCPAQPLEFREDSRLLRVHRRQGESVVTQDFLWSYASQQLEKAGQSSQGAEQFCRNAAMR